MKVTKEQATKLLTEIKEVLAKDIDYNNFVIVLKKDGLHLSSSAKTNILLGVNVTCNLIESVKMAKENRKLTAYNVAFPNILISYLDKNALTDDNQLTRLCETIVEKAKKIDEFLNLIYTFDISPVIVESDENIMDAKRVLPSNEYSFGKTNNAFYPVRYSRVSTNCKILLSKV